MTEENQHIGYYHFVVEPFHEDFTATSPGICWVSACCNVPANTRLLTDSEV